MERKSPGCATVLIALGLAAYAVTSWLAGDASGASPATTTEAVAGSGESSE